MTYEEFCKEWIPLGEDLLRVAIRLLDSKQDAEDAVQDLFIKLWQQRETLVNVYNPPGYATRVLKNLCIDRIRTAKPNAELPEELQGYESADTSIENRETIRRTAEVIEKLPENQRKVLEMKVLEGLTYEEISERTGLTTLSLRVLLSRARATLKIKV